MSRSKTSHRYKQQPSANKSSADTGKNNSPTPTNQRATVPLPCATPGLHIHIIHSEHRQQLKVKMGKKRTSTTKKKQISKKNSRLSSTYGVSVLKGGVKSRKKVEVLDENLSSAGCRSITNKICGTSRNSVSYATNSSILPTKDNRSSHRYASEIFPPTVTCEYDDFQHRHASLEERSLAAQARHDECRKIKQMRRNGRLTRPSTTVIAPATLTLAPKSTQELVDDATYQVSRGMNEIGRNATNFGQTNDTLTIQGQSSLAAAAAGLNWRIGVSNTHHQTPLQKSNNNPYAELENDSDNSWAENNRKIDLHKSFQFKPASFSFQPTNNIPDAIPKVECSSNDDIDPDL